MRAIQTKWLGPTNTRGSRVKASTEAFPRGVTVSWDYGAGNGTGQSDVEANHDSAARAFIVSKGWHGVWVRGSTRDGFVYVCLSREIEGRPFKVPHPQAANPLDILIVRVES
jgi:hypothetical protein